MAWFTDEEDQALALLIAENEDRLHLAGDDQKEKGLVWDVICSKFYETTTSTDKSRRQIRERYRSLQRSEVGQKKLKAAREKKLKAARDDFEVAQALLELAAGSRVH